MKKIVFKRLYVKNELTVETYGRGHDKVFIVYTDYTHDSETGPRWHTRVYPDIKGNKAKATQQALKWLNEGNVGEPWVVRNSPSKIFLSYI